MDFEVKHEVKFRDMVFDTRYHPSSDVDLIVAVTIAGDVHL